MDSCAGFPGHVLRYAAGQVRATCACGALVDVPYHSAQVDAPEPVPEFSTVRAALEIAIDNRAALQAIMQVLGPTAPDSAECCPGCTYEIGEALRILRAAGVEYRPRKG